MTLWACDSQRTAWGVNPLLQPCGFQDWTQPIRLGSRCLYTLSRLTGPFPWNFKLSIYLSNAKALPTKYQDVIGQWATSLAEIHALPGQFTRTFGFFVKWEQVYWCVLRVGCKWQRPTKTFISQREAFVMKGKGPNENQLATHFFWSVWIFTVTLWMVLPLVWPVNCISATRSYFRCAESWILF